MGRRHSACGSSDDLWIVGLGMVALHRTGAGFAVVDTSRRLLTVHGNETSVVAVGGIGSGYLAPMAASGPPAGTSPPSL